MDVSVAEDDLEQFIGELSDHIGEDWKALARSLGLKKTDIDAISHDNQGSLKEQIYQFFEKWKQRNGRNATVQQLVDGLRKAKLFDQLQNLQEAGFISKGADSMVSPHTQSKKNSGSSACKEETEQSKSCPEHNENCYCGMPVKERTTTKGKNKGKVFYNCSNSTIKEQCHYFRWKEDVRPPPPPRCGKCGLSCIFWISKRRNQNWGKKLWRCSKCGFHDWIEKGELIKKGLKRKRSYPQTSTKLTKKMKLNA